jgi:hypothetical protein
LLVDILPAFAQRVFGKYFFFLHRCYLFCIPFTWECFGEEARHSRG